MAAIETLGTTITSALQRASNPGPSAEALAFVKRLFHHLFLSRDFEFNLATSSVTISSGTISLSGVTRFRNAHVLKITDIESPLEEIPYKDIWPLVEEANDNSTTGTPGYFAVNPARTSIILYPVPQSTYTTGDLLYYKIPDTSAYTTSTTPEYEDSLALESAICDWALNYDKEPLQVIVERQAKMLHDAYVTMADATGRANQRTLRWGRAFRYVPGD